MFEKKSGKKPTFTKASTPEGLRRQRAAIKRFYAEKRAKRSSAKLLGTKNRK